MASIFEQLKKVLHSKSLLLKSRLNERAFIRNRLLPFSVLVTYIMNMIRKSLQLEISSFANFINLPDVSKQAFSQARQKLSAETFITLNRSLIKEFYSDNEVETFKGFRVLAIDGSTIRLPKVDALYNYFKANKEDSVPLANVSLLYDVFNNLSLNATLQPYIGTSEKSMGMEHFQELDNLNKDINTKYNDIILFDRGYLSHFLIFFLHQNNKNFLFRASTSTISEVADVLKSTERDVIVNVVLTKEKLKYKPDFKKYDINLDNMSIKVRVTIHDLPSGEKEILVSSLIDQTQISYDELFYLYGKRWNIEENYKLFKCITAIENFSGESKLAIEQDFYATVFTCNIGSMLAQEAQEEVNLAAADKETKYEYKINRNILIGTLKNEILEVFLGDQDLTLFCNKLKQRLKRSLVAVRPGRSFKRFFRYRNRRPLIHKNCL